MRTRDVVGLALVALWQRKTRALLTTLGVAVGSFVLVTSLSIGQGVQGMLLEQLRKQDQLRRIIVWQGNGGRPEDVPPADLVITGEMSEARRQRLREAIVRRWQAPPHKAPPGLTAAQIAELKRLEHVVSVTPALSWTGKARLDGKEQPVFIRTASPDDRGVERRLLAGRFLVNGESEGILVSEIVVYRWGVRNEADVDTVLGRRVRLEVSQPATGPAALLSLLNVNRPNLTPNEMRVLRKAMARLPAALAHLDLPEDDQKVLLGLLGESRPDKKRTIVEEQPIVGVFRDVTRAEMSPWDSPPRPVDVLVPAATAEKMYFAVPGRKALPTVLVRRGSRGQPERGGQSHQGDGPGGVLAGGAGGPGAAEHPAHLDRLHIRGAGGPGRGGAGDCQHDADERPGADARDRRDEGAGARDGHVQAMFLMEGVLIGALGAVLGLLASWLVSYPGDEAAYWIVAQQTPMRLEGSVFVFPLWLTTGVPLLVCLLTTAAAVYPARRAARIDPIAALRQR